MLCEVGTSHGFLALWIAMSALGLLAMILLSGALFYPYYMNPTFERWQFKNNPTFPSPLLVKKEIIHMCKGLSVATLCPAFTLMASKWNISHGYCGQYDSKGSDSISPLPLWIQAVLIFFFTDLYEYVYHWIGHRFSLFWSVHRHHHKFYNPSPFAVIADEYLDQFVRTMPMVILPYFTPINMDLLFAIFATLFYGYGVYLHWGYETPLLTAHNPIFNTAYHHYTHHAVSAIGRPTYTGFFFKLWDQVFDTGYESCHCFLCRPQRTIEEWNAVSKPDYSVLLSPKWWLQSTASFKTD